MKLELTEQVIEGDNNIIDVNDTLGALDYLDSLSDDYLLGLKSPNELIKEIQKFKSNSRLCSMVIWFEHELKRDIRSNLTPPRKSNEKELHKQLVEVIKSSDDYQYIGSEIVMSETDRDKLDILCKCKETGRPVIMELKVGAKSAHKQLRSYAVHYDNPILINVSETLPKTMRNDITYKTYADFGITKQK
ncbi:hypothetical protein [Photobacterium damselae]|uniref:hypothetical protein n=1 Tax=Photobacterium damselae TaxID=38293 RepID=UPI00165E478A|nr:hypothetical protein [Photobacterium damselae]